MEKGSFCSNMKQRSISNSARNMKQMHEFKVNVSSLGYVSDYSTKTGEGDLVVGGFSWPPRSYVCSFCKREFRSAQALGGHMNVHRRDRARLRQSPTSDGGSNSNNGGKFSTLNLDLEPNPSFYSNPIFFSSSPPPVSSLLTKIPQFTSKLPPLGLSYNEMKRCGGEAVLVQNRRPVIDGAKGLLDVERFEPSVYKRGRELVRLDLEMGLVTPSKEELDLELRLGYT